MMMMMVILAINCYSLTNMMMVMMVMVMMISAIICNSLTKSLKFPSASSNSDSSIPSFTKRCRYAFLKC